MKESKILKNRERTLCRFVLQNVVFFLLSSPINHPTTPRVYLVTLRRGPTPGSKTTGLNQTEYKAGLQRHEIFTLR